MKKIKINDQQVHVESKTIAELLKELNIPSPGIAVAVNDEIVPKAEHGTQVINEGDRLDIIRPIGGG